MTQTTTITVPAARFADHDDSLASAAAWYVEAHPEAEGWDLSVRWGEDRATILMDVPRDPGAFSVSNVAGGDLRWFSLEGAAMPDSAISYCEGIGYGGPEFGGPAADAARSFWEALQEEVTEV